MLDHVLACAAMDMRGTVSDAIRAFIDKVRSDEQMVTGDMYEHATRRHSPDIAAGLIRGRFDPFGRLPLGISRVNGEISDFIRGEVSNQE